jgi:uracil-DNA glycosylase
MTRDEPLVPTSSNRPADWPEGLTDWEQALAPRFSEPWCGGLAEFVREERRRYQVFPQAADVFRALQLTALSDVKFVILGQDPYHGEGQAHGLSFSVRKGVRIPPSLGNIFRELQSDTGVSIPASGDLTAWARRGGLLLNTVLTVRAGKANAHRRHGWESFTDAVIQLVNQRRRHVAFVLWGAAAGRKAGLIDTDRHLVLQAAHPSPLSARRGFFGSRPFSRINEYRSRHGLAEIVWSLDEARADVPEGETNR